MRLQGDCSAGCSSCCDAKGAVEWQALKFGMTLGFLGLGRRRMDEGLRPKFKCKMEGRE